MEEPPISKSQMRTSSAVAYISEMRRRTDLYLGRSGRHPLTVIVHVSSVGGYSSIWSMLLRRSDLWKDADLWVSNGYMMHGLSGRRG